MASQKVKLPVYDLIEVTISKQTGLGKKSHQQHHYGQDKVKRAFRFLAEIYFAVFILDHFPGFRFIILKFLIHRVFPCIHVCRLLSVDSPQRTTDIFLEPR